MTSSLFFLAAAVAGGSFIDHNRNGRLDPYENAALPPETRAADLIPRMTIEEKAMQLSQMEIHSKNVRELVLKGLGSVIWFDQNNLKERNLWQHDAIEKTRLGIPIIFGMDIIHGNRLMFPISLGLACSFEPELFEKMQTVAAREASADGLDWVFAPMCDLSRDPRWGRVAETCGEDPYLGSLCCAAQVRGFQGADPSQPGRVAACLKHFVGYSAVTGGRDYSDSEVTPWTLWNMHLPNFRAGVKAGALTAMSSFNTYDGVPAVANRYLLTDVLRGALGFSGYVVSDWESTEELMKWGVASDKSDSVAQAINAGNDLEMMSSCYRDGIPAAVADGRLSEATLDEAVRRVLLVKFRLGLFDRPFVDEVAAAKVTDDVDRNCRGWARECAEKSMVLLKNTGVLPLDKAKLRKVALIGPVVDDRIELNGCWCFHGKPLKTTIAEAIRTALPAAEVTVVKGCSINTEPATKIGQDGVIVADREAKSPDKALDLEGAVKAANAAEVVIMTLDENRWWTGENASRASLSLTGRQQELFDAVAKTGKPIVAVVFSGRPLVLPEIWDKAAAVIYGWQPGSEGPKALANLLTGVAAPCARLSISVPYDISQVPAFYNRPITGRPQYGYYRDTKERYSRYPFGFGLTYTTFKYGEVTLSGKTVRCTVTNTGKREGTEVVQLYIHQQVCRAGWRPICELRGFKRVTLKPGESVEVAFEITGDTLGYVDRDGGQKVDHGEYRLWIAPNSRDLGKGVEYEK